jgi:CubicO group peptidase (beta-lactamase class C family)
MKRKIRLFIVGSLLCVIGVGLVYVWRIAFLIGGVGAKNLCSCVMVGNRSADDVIANELNIFPLTYGKYVVDMADSSAKGTVLGIISRKAIYRKGFGCTLISDRDERELRAQKFHRHSQGRRLEYVNAPWPKGEKAEPADSFKIDVSRVRSIVDSTFDEGLSNLRQVRAIVVVHDGKIVAERYGKGFDENSMHNGWSMTKSIVNALVGLLVKEGKLNINDSALLSEWENDERAYIQLDHLLRCNSGLTWEENYGGPSPVTNMLYKSANMGRYASDYALESKPGTVFKYSSGSTNILSNIIRQKLGERYHTYPYDSLFRELGMNNTILELDSDGSFVGSSYCFATARDWARFGLLYCNDGKWFGEQILPPGWVEYTTTPQSGTQFGGYGAQFWLTSRNQEEYNKKSYPNDLFWADGFEGQRLFIIPSKKLVIVKLALTRGNNFNENKFLDNIVDCVK